MLSNLLIMGSYVSLMQKTVHDPARSGFTLLELAIVLVVIGLIVGAIFVGQDLINTSRIRQQVTQIQKIATATNLFKIKYNALPGDFCSQAPAVGLACEGGNDNGEIDDDLGHTLDDGTGVHDMGYEAITFFGQLVDANLLESHFVCAPLAPNIPSSDTWGNYALTINPNGSMLAETHLGFTWLLMGLVFTPGTCTVSWIGGYHGPVMTPYQAFSIDQKIDDGIPGTGSFYATIVPGGNVQGAVDTNAGQCVVDATAQKYNVTNPQTLCSILVKLN